MTERDRSYMTIYRGGNEYMKVPITPSCVIKYTLMKENYIRLNFVSDKAYEFRVGDYIEDEIFGKFYILDEQTPKDNGGVYQYELMFHAPCYRWKNRKMMLLTKLVTDEPYRKETVWSFTGTLAQSVDILLQNVKICGYGSYAMKIEASIETKAAECHNISFNGTDIITALNTFCNSDNWNCEWWVEEKEVTMGEITYQGTLHLGKCDLGLTEGMEEYNFTPQRLQSMNINRSQTSYFNKLYCFGSTNNIPTTYRKELKVTITDKKRFSDTDSLHFPINLNAINYDMVYNVAQAERNGEEWDFRVLADREFEYLEGQATDADNIKWNADTIACCGKSETFTLPNDAKVSINSSRDLTFNISIDDYNNEEDFPFAVKVDVRLRDEEWANGGTDKGLYSRTILPKRNDRYFGERLEDTDVSDALTTEIHENIDLKKGTYFFYISYKVILPPFREIGATAITKPQYRVGTEYMFAVDAWMVAVYATMNVSAAIADARMWYVLDKDFKPDYISEKTEYIDKRIDELSWEKEYADARIMTNDDPDYDTSDYDKEDPDYDKDNLPYIFKVASWEPVHPENFYYNAKGVGYTCKTHPIKVVKKDKVKITVPQFTITTARTESEGSYNHNTFEYLIRYHAVLLDANGHIEEDLAIQNHKWQYRGLDEFLSTTEQYTIEGKEINTTLDAGTYTIALHFELYLGPYRSSSSSNTKVYEGYKDFETYCKDADMWGMSIHSGGFVKIKTNMSNSTLVRATYAIGSETRYCEILFNPSGLAEGRYPDSSRCGFAIVDEYGNWLNHPDFTTEQALNDNPDPTKTCTLTLLDATSIDIPTAYYTSPYDSPFALAQVGDRRLKLPLGERIINDKYLLKDGYITTIGIEEKDIVEEAVVFEKIYPSAHLLVDTVSTRKKRTVEEHEEDGSKDTWEWLEYALTFVHHDTKAPFLFEKRYLLPGEKAKVRFLTPDDVGLPGFPTVGYKLTGMTFEAQYFENTDKDNDGDYPANSFALVQNRDFGALLPSDETLYPTVGDGAEVIGFNIKALPQLGFIEEAEEELLQKGIEYLEAVNDNNITAECVPTAQYLFDLRKYQQFYTADKKPFYTANGDAFFVRNVNEYELLDIGAPVYVHSDLFKGGVFKSRIIGFEYKLDKPYDNPKYTIGETEAYSRLRQIEKNITKLS